MKLKNLKYILFCWLLFNLYACSNKKIMKTKPEKIKPIINEIKKEDRNDNTEEMTNFLSEYLKLKYKGWNFNKYMYVSVKHQELYLVENDSTIKKYPISTSKKGIGNKQNSFKTPYGLHIIKRKIGDDVPLGGIFESRVYDGQIATIYTQKIDVPTDFVTSRIMWLEGEENGINRGRNIDSYNRFIYIHGTAEEGLIGQPASHGCIRMKNKDVIELYNLVDEGTPILSNSHCE